MPITFLTNEDKTVIDQNIAKLSAEIEEVTEEFIGKNIFNPNDSDVVSGYVSKNNGSITTHSTYYASGFIPIKSGAIYAFCGGGVTHNAVYNSDKTYNSQPTVTSVSGWVTFTSNVDGYLRFTINNANAIATAMVIEVDSLTELADYKPSNYIPYYTYKLPVGVEELRTKIRENIHIYASDGINDFYSKMSAAYESGNCDVYIGKGNYIYTNDLIDTIRAENKRGVPIGNGCRYFFESGAKLYCEYTGDSTDDVVEFFSPLDSQSAGGDYEIYNLDLTAKNVCYAIHDEANGAEEFYKHVFKNCWVELDNSALESSGNSLSKALGGGLGQHTEIILENCVFKATNPANTSSILNVASYHGANNSTFTDAKIIVMGCYFDGGNFRTSDLSVNTESPYPRVIYTGNSSKGAANLTSTWDVKAWNNETRS